MLKFFDETYYSKYKFETDEDYATKGLFQRLVIFKMVLIQNRNCDKNTVLISKAVVVTKIYINENLEVRRILSYWIKGML